MADSAWLALMIGNSRLHWAYFWGDRLESTGDSEHLTGSPSTLDLEEILGTASPGIWEEGAVELNGFPVVLASVVPEQTQLWHDYPNLQILTLNQIPLQHTYPTLGIDRALALWGAGEMLSWPALVIDAGTALTFTGGDRERQLIGGAILPGLSLQLRSLAQKTAALPAIALPQTLPNRWAQNTPEAIQSGIIHTVVAGVVDFIQAWWRDFPNATVVITGGDRDLLHHYLQLQHPAIAKQVQVDPSLIFWGIRACRETLRIG